MGQYFRHLRKIPWIPEFKWVDTAEEAADTINRPHKDYPERVSDTKLAIQNIHLFAEDAEPSIDTDYLLGVHYQVFGEEKHAGQFRRVNVKVGDHVCPHPSVLESMMEDLVHIHKDRFQTMNDFSNPLGAKVIIDWYTDFETIHPFEDGDGRVGGIIVALFSHKWFPEKGYLVPGQ